MVRRQHIEAAQTGLCMLASIEKWVTHYDMFADFGGTSQTYGNLCYFTSYFTNIKC